MLYVIGIGAKKEHITPDMLEAISSSEEVFLEYYTSFYQTPFDELEKYIGKKIIIAKREVIESEIEEKIIGPAKDKNIALLVLGDPLIATTHTDLLLRAKEMGVKTKLFNNVSIGNFITRTGLQFYKFGKITSIPFHNEKFMPRTPYLVFIDNHKMGAHSLFLLDLDPINKKYLKAHEALEFLLKIPTIMKDEEEIEEKESYFLDEETDIVLCSRLGFDDEVIRYGTLAEIIMQDKKEHFKEPLCVIIPGDMHEMEVEFLKQFQ